MKFPPISLGCYFQECVTVGEFKSQSAVIETPWESPRPYWNSLPLPNSRGSIAGLLQLIFICLQKIKPSPGKGHCFPKEESPFMLIPARNWLFRKKKKKTGWFLPWLERKQYFFFNWGWWECAIVCMRRNFLTSVNPFTELDKANNNNSNNNGVFVYLLNNYSILHTILSSIIHELSDLMVTSAFCVSY